MAEAGTGQTGAGQTGASQTVTGLAFDPEAQQLGLLGTPALAAKANDLEALRTSVVDSAGVGFGIWITWLGALSYLAIAAGGVTHRDLFFESPVKLPFLNIDLPLKSFFILAPPVFVFLHAYVLLHFVMLSSKIAAFDHALQTQIDDLKIRTALRRQLPSNIFVQFLAGPRDLRNGIVGALLWLIALFTLTIGPFALLALFELQFLPYHSAGISWLQRIMVVIDVILAWRFWPAIARRDVVAINRDDETPSLLSRARYHAVSWAAPLTGGLAMLLVFPIATFPGEWLEQTIPRTFVPLAGGNGENIPVLTWARNQLVDGEIDPAKGVPESWFSNRLVLPNLEAAEYLKQDPDGRIVAVRRSTSLRDRDLRRVVLSGAHLRNMDLTAADLRDAVLDRADLREARLDCAVPLEAGRDAGLVGPAPRRAAPKCTQLRGASLNQASLQGASLIGASLQGASLTAASLQGASLTAASLQGASLDGALLQGSSLDGASLQGASMVAVSLQGARLDFASLQGTWLVGASLQGASMVSVLLQGASLHWASLQSASLRGSFVWRTDPTADSSKAADAADIHIGPERSCDDAKTQHVCAWTIDTFKEQRASLEDSIQAGPARDRALQQFDNYLRPGPFEKEAEFAAQWNELKQRTSSVEVIEADRTIQLQAAGCDPDGAPYVVTGLARHLTTEYFEISSPQRAALAAAFLDPACAGARGISTETSAALRTMVATAKPVVK